MALIQKQANPNSSGDSSSSLVDEKKRKRMQSNRESARRSRMRKQQQMEDLTKEISQLQISNGQLLQLINAKEQENMQLESMNNVLRAQAMELTDRLQSLNSVLQIFEEVSGLAVDIPEVPDPFLKPWQIPQPILPMVASADMSLC